MNTKLRQRIGMAEMMQVKADNAKRKIYDHIKFLGFRSNQPELSVCAESGFTIVFKGKELDKDDVLYYMETRGYITPYDF